MSSSHGITLNKPTPTPKITPVSHPSTTNPVSDSNQAERSQVLKRANTPTASPIRTPEPTPRITKAPTPSPTVEPTPEPTVPPTPSPTPSPTPTKAPTPSPTPTKAPTPSPTPTKAPTPSPTPAEPTDAESIQNWLDEEKRKEKAAIDAALDKNTPPQTLGGYMLKKDNIQRQERALSVAREQAQEEKKIVEGEASNRGGPGTYKGSNYPAEKASSDNVVSRATDLVTHGILTGATAVGSAIGTSVDTVVDTVRTVTNPTPEDRKEEFLTLNTKAKPGIWIGRGILNAGSAIGNGASAVGGWLGRTATSTANGILTGAKSLGNWADDKYTKYYEEKARKAKEEAERKAKEEAERKELEELKKKEKARKAKEEAERKAKEEAERKELEELKKKEKARKAKEEADRKAKEEADRKAKEEADRKAKAATPSPSPSPSPSIAAPVRQFGAWGADLVKDAAQGIGKELKNTTLGTIERFGNLTDYTIRSAANLLYNQTTDNGTDELAVNGLASIKKSAEDKYDEWKKNIKGEYNKYAYPEEHMKLELTRLRSKYGNETTNTTTQTTKADRKIDDTPTPTPAMANITTIAPRVPTGEGISGNVSTTHNITEAANVSAVEQPVVNVTQENATETSTPRQDVNNERPEVKEVAKAYLEKNTTQVLEAE
ncbi:sensory perception of sound protein family, partial [Trichomonas vaginalis G3]|uniref:sensory perception of sound protein family n=1 Tax=Trichomonas vaginalis (strain ATCC PRA-98 / G3) TaxID=412133 RepID=UPI0021E5872A